MARHKTKPSANGKAPKGKRVPAAAKKQPAVEEEVPACDSEDTMSVAHSSVPDTQSNTASQAGSVLYLFFLELGNLSVWDHN